MKLLSVISLLCLLSFPIFWNGISLIHYVVEHTHTFCETDLEHSHPNPDDCLTILQLAENNSQSQLPSTTKIEFQDLQQYLTPNLYLTSIAFSSFSAINFANFSLPNDGYLKDVFHPPTFA